MPSHSHACSEPMRSDSPARPAAVYKAIAAGFERPIPGCYWVWPGRLMAGEYPGAPNDVEAGRRIERLLTAGVTFFLDLTEKGEYGLTSYAPLLSAANSSRKRKVVHRRMPIPDGGTPSQQEMVRILNAIDAALADGHVVYVHCWGGIGRTGTVIGCYLVRHGRTGCQALRELLSLRQGTPNAECASPQTREQWRMVLEWYEAAMEGCCSTAAQG